MECLDLDSGTWMQLSPMNTHRHGLGVAVLGGTLYAVGGHDGWSYLNTVERLVFVLKSCSTKVLLLHSTVTKRCL